MKTLYSSVFTALLLLALGPVALAQNDIKLDIKHKLLEDDFAFSQEAQTPEGKKFNLSRLEYYITEVKVTHDGGQVTEFDDLWILVNASSSSAIALDTASIDSVESIAFSVGVNPEHNHLDPASWPMTHPLAPKSPSMHWGWAAGYRFVAMEGMGGDQLNQVFEIHALDDANYFETSVDVSAKAAAGEVTISIFADYTQALKGVDVSSGVISHGGTGEAATLLQNFRDYVFMAEAPVDTSSNDTIIDTTLAVGSVEHQMKLILAPNPSQNGVVRMLASDNDVNALDVTAYDITGKQVAFERVNGVGLVELTGFETGIYFIRANDTRSGLARTLKVTVIQ